VAPRTDAKKTCLLKENRLYAQNMIALLGTIVNIIGGGGKPIQPFDGHMNLHFDNESFIQYEVHKF
jgi:hypothetical protein